MDDTTGAGIAFPYPFGYPIVNKVLVDWAKSSSHVVISTKTEAKLARLILQDFVKVCITWLDPHLRPAERKGEPVFSDSFSLGSHQPSKSSMSSLEDKLAESRAATVKPEEAVESKLTPDPGTVELLAEISTMRAKDALTRTLLYFCHYVLEPSLHTTLLQVYQNKVFEDRDVVMSWVDAETTILQGKIEEISFDFYVRAFTFRRADNSTLRSWLVQAQNFLLAMGSKDIKLCDRDKVAFVLRNVSPREMEKFSKDALAKGITPMLSECVWEQRTMPNFSSSQVQHTCPEEAR